MIIEIKDHLIPIHNILWVKLHHTENTTTYYHSYIYVAIDNNSVEISFDNKDEAIRLFQQLKDLLSKHHNNG